MPAGENITCQHCVLCSVLQEHREGLKELKQLERQYRSVRQQQVADMPVSYKNPLAPTVHVSQMLSVEVRTYVRVGVHIRTYVQVYCDLVQDCVV